jgi:dienelactone hydrolase
MLKNSCLVIVSVFWCLIAGNLNALAQPEEIPLGAILGDKNQLTEWRSKFEKRLASLVNTKENVSPIRSRILKEETIDEIRLMTIAFEYSEGSVLYGKTAGGILAVPGSTDRAKPLLIAIHGHEHAPWGQFPLGLFEKKSWPYSLAKAGYIVWAPVSMYHDEIKEAAAVYGYIPLWTQIISKGIDHAAIRFFSKLPHSGYAVLGLSSGGHQAFTLMALRQDIKAGVFAGADQPLQFLRTEYRIENHPNCWDIPGIASYTSILAMIAPRPIQFQLGKNDPFYPSGEPFPPQGSWFKGTSRDIYSDEVGGQILILRSIWHLMGGREVKYFIHNGGHEMDAREAVSFLNQAAINKRNQSGVNEFGLKE